jgi:transposase-like protein
VFRLPPANVGDRRYGHASEQVDAADVVRGDPPADEPFERHFRRAGAGTIRHRQLQAAWLLLHKLRRAMVSPDRSLLQAMVETDETEVPLRSKHDPIKGYGIPNVGKLLIIGAVELSPDGHPRRVRLEPLRDRTGENVRGFVERVVAPDATVVSDGLASYLKLGEHRHVGKTVGNMAAHILLPWVHRVFANLKRWLTGTFHGVRKQHLKRYLDEFTFRWNRRRHTRTAFDNLLGLVTRLPHASLRDFVDQRV